MLVAADFRGRDVCGPCAGTTIDYTCRTCGQAEERYRHGECVRCVARSKLEDQFRRPDGSVPAELTPLLAALAAAHRPRSVLAWVERGDGSAALLRDLVRSGCAITHEALDAATRQQAAAALREMLVHAGVLPRRDEQLERLAPWLSRTLATAPAHHRQVLRAYGNWSVLRRARLRADRTRFTAASARNARLKVSTALTFLRWLDTTDLTLERARQAHVDTWIEDGGLNRRLLGDFLTWASRRGLAQKLSVAAITPSGPDLSMTEDQRWALLDRLLHDTTISVDVRTAASLLLIYGLPVTFIATLTTDNVTTSGGKHFLQVKEHRTQLPPAVAALITQAASAARTSSLVGRAVPGTPWLFPGRLAGRPISAAALCQRLRQHGIRIRRARNSALISLAEDLPAPVLSKILGISITAAIRWTRYARRDWLPFVGERAASAASRSQR
ncbi:MULTISPECIES: site-specific integrase [Micromonosporaceae]|uniref:Site-specific recombinase XerD n=1 Tax=Catellatospora coxensis TaxID=310354 RepID=A0A8J3P6G4_9ACTN|nr:MULTISPECIES: hypothetical protein [Micromonosporaceae]GIG05688.1 hypothetical protein Cco03nite_23880 [Catellatospora coxensis]